MKMFNVIAEQYQSTGYWELLWAAFYGGRLKKAFRMPRNFIVFYPILRKTLAVIPVYPEYRLANCRYRLGKGDYLYTITELNILFSYRKYCRKRTKFSSATT